MTRGYHDVYFRLAIIPGKSLTSAGVVPLNANKKDMEDEMNLGYNDGLNAV
jgi:hypothetical protein